MSWTRGTPTRVVFSASPGLESTLKALSSRMGLPKVGTLRMCVSLIASLMRQLDKGGKLIFRGPDGSEREFLIPVLELGPGGVFEADRELTDGAAEAVSFYGMKGANGGDQLIKEEAKTHEFRDSIVSK